MTLINEDILYIFNALKPHESRLVGGITRDFLHRNIIAEDVDIATQATPEENTKLLEAAGIKVIPTGLKHGTVTAIYKNKPYEITTLRKDIDTNGRHATVTFTTDFKEDALRRDFTFNALYMDEQGNIHDYHGGKEDLEKRHVRFIGEAEERIKEDYLRILRYFRFHGKFEEEPKFDGNTLAVIKSSAENLKTLSKERITTEMVKILNDLHVGSIFKAMEETNCLKHIGLSEPSLESYKNLTAFDKTSTWAKLVCLYPSIELPKTMLNFSNKEKQTIKGIQKALNTINPNTCLKTQAYKLGKEPCLQAFQVRYAQTLSEEYLNAYKELTQIETPAFDVQGRDLMNLNEPAGPELGKQLKTLETWWLENEFPNKETCLQHFVSNIQKNSR